MRVRVCVCVCVFVCVYVWARVKCVFCAPLSSRMLLPIILPPVLWQLDVLAILLCAKLGICRLDIDEEVILLVQKDRVPGSQIAKMTLAVCMRACVRACV